MDGKSILEEFSDFDLSFIAHKTFIGCPLDVLCPTELLSEASNYQPKIYTKLMGLKGEQKTICFLN